MATSSQLAGAAQLGFGLFGLYQKNTSGTYKNDQKAGGKRALYASTSLATDGAGVALGLAASIPALADTVITRNIPIFGTALTAVSAGLDVAAASSAKDGHRVAQSFGAGVGGLASMAVLAASERFIPMHVMGSLLVGTALGVAGSYAGAHMADKMMGNELQHNYDIQKKMSARPSFVVHPVAYGNTIAPAPYTGRNPL